MAADDDISQRRILFFGTPDEAVWVLEVLATHGIVPTLIVTNPPRPAGRGHRLTPPPALMWAQKRAIPTYTPARLTEDARKELEDAGPWDVGIVAAYGALIPPSLLALPRHGIVNIHPSLLPRLRGAAPVQGAILQDEPDAVGVSIIHMDEQMDHGPIIVQEAYTPPQWPTPYRPLQEQLMRRGATLLAEVLPAWIAGRISPLPQDHTRASYAPKLQKCEVSLDDAPSTLWKYYCAYVPRPGMYFWDRTGPTPTRVKILEATWDASQGFLPRTIVPEGEKPVAWDVWRSRHTSSSSARRT